MAEGLGQLVEGYLAATDLQMKKARELTQKQLEQSKLELDKQQAQQHYALAQQTANRQATQDWFDNLAKMGQQGETNRHNLETEKTAAVRAGTAADAAESLANYRKQSAVLREKGLNQKDNAEVDSLYYKFYHDASQMYTDKGIAAQIARANTDNAIAHSRVGPPIQVDPERDQALIHLLSGIGPSNIQQNKIADSEVARRLKEEQIKKTVADTKVAQERALLVPAIRKLTESVTYLDGQRGKKIAQDMVESARLLPFKIAEIATRTQEINKQRELLTTKIDKAHQEQNWLKSGNLLGDPTYVRANENRLATRVRQLGSELTTDNREMRLTTQDLGSVIRQIRTPPPDLNQNPPVPYPPDSSEYKSWQRSITPRDPNNPASVDGDLIAQKNSYLDMLEQYKKRRADIYAEIKGINDARMKAGTLAVTTGGGRPLSVQPFAPQTIRPTTTRPAPAAPVRTAPQRSAPAPKRKAAAPASSGEVNVGGKKIRYRIK